MAMTYLPHDTELKAGIRLEVATAGFQFGIFNFPRLPIEFQFVPKIMSDSRKGSWDEEEVIGQEPVSTLATAGPRIMSMTWTYIVDSLGDKDGAFGNNGPWTIPKIKRNINALKGYFVQAKAIQAAGDATHGGLVAYLEWPMVAGKGKWSVRITSVDVKTSDNMVGDRNLMYPVKSDVTIDLRLWTTGILVESGDDDAKVQNVDGLYDMPIYSNMWY